MQQTSCIQRRFLSDVLRNSRGKLGVVSDSGMSPHCHVTFGNLARQASDQRA
jgi:hypothetical protein